MGVHGLWKLIESAGKPVPVETLDNKVLAIDVSIWLHQLMKGYQNPSGSSVSNAYLLGLFSRVCKLLFTNVKPVFVFDGGVPQLKRKTIADRQRKKEKSDETSKKLREKLLKNLLKQKAVSQVLEEIRGQTSPKKKAPDMYELPLEPEADDSPSDVEVMSSSSSEDDVNPIKMKYKDLHTIDVNSADFKALPADMRHDILTELKETRKESSWGRLHEMPEESGDFSSYQMSRLLKRRSVQVSLEEAEKEMGGRTLSLNDVEALLAEGGIEINPQLGKRIASDDVTRYIYVRETGEQSNSSQNYKFVQSANSTEGETSTSMAASVPEIKIKEEIIDSDSDVEFAREVEAIEAMHYQIKEEKVQTLHSEIIEENVEFGMEDMFHSGSSSEGIIIDAMDLYKDNGGLSQEQILAIIKQQNIDKTKPVDPVVGNDPTTSCENISLNVNLKGNTSGVSEGLDQNSFLCSINIINPKLTKDERTDLSQTCLASEPKILDSLRFKFHKAEPILSQKVKNKKSEEIANTQSVNKRFVHKVASNTNARKCLNSVNLSTMSSNSSDSETENSHSLPCEVSTLVLPSTENMSCSKVSSKNDNAINEQPKDNSNNILHTASELSSSESDSDFVEVSPPKDEELHPSENNKTITGLHIEIIPTQSQVEDDIFADIFLDEKNVTNSAINKDTTNISVDSKTLLSENVHTEKLREKCEIGCTQRLKEKDADKIFTQNQITEVTENSVHLNFFPTVQNTSLNMDSDEARSSLADNEIFMKNNTTPASTDEVNTTPASTDEVNTTPASTDEVNTTEVVEEPCSSTTLGTQNESEDSEDADDPGPKPKTKSSGVNTEEKPKRTLNTMQLEKLQDILETKERELLIDQNREDRLATSITDQMYQEAQELLRLFGVPYVVAPMEAEAQCAFLDSAGLTQGTITDDSDIWLFGGRKVYKNFFDQKKFVLEFQADAIQHYFKLSRNELVLLALLVGSDYTMGLQGVGPVTALEILATFPPPQTDSRDSQELLTSLTSFKQWWESESQTYAPLAKKLKNVELHHGFPSPAVVHAYLQPVVDDSREPFSWGNPDLPGLRDYAERKFGWKTNRTDQILLPVINKLSQKTNQLTLHTFFGAVPNVPAHREQMSRRVQLAVNRLEGGSEEFEPVQPRQRQQRSRGRGRADRSEQIGVRGRGRGRNTLDNNERLCVHESDGKAPEVIPQREKDRLEAAKRKQHAIEIIKNKKSKGMKKRNVRQVKPEAELSESSSDD